MYSPTEGNIPPPPIHIQHYSENNLPNGLYREQEANATYTADTKAEPLESIQNNAPNTFRPLPRLSDSDT